MADTSVVFRYESGTSYSERVADALVGREPVDRNGSPTCCSDGKDMSSTGLTLLDELLDPVDRGGGDIA